MKAILCAIALLVTGGAAYFTLEHSRKYELVQAKRLQTIDTNKNVSANADATENDLKKEKGVLKDTEEARTVLQESIRALNSTIGAIEPQIAELDNELAAQEEEFEELRKTMEEIRQIIDDLGDDGVTLDNLAQKIEEIEDQLKARRTDLDEKKTLVEGAENLLAKNEGELGELVRRKSRRDQRISRNAMSSVITAVNQDWGFLVIGAGANSGFTPQTTLIVERDGRYIGRVRPSSIEATQTLAEIDFKSLAAGVRLQPGDRVILERPTTN